MIWEWYLNGNVRFLVTNDAHDGFLELLLGIGQLRRKPVGARHHGIVAAVHFHDETFDEIEALVERVDDVVARIERHHAEFDVGQQVGVVVDLIQRVEQRL